MEVENKFGTDFIICEHCKNVTLRIEYASRQVMSREEAERLVTAEGFTCWQEGAAAGHMVRAYSHLSILGAADLNRLNVVVEQAKDQASRESGEQGRADTFEATIEPALAEIVNTVRNQRLTTAARDRLCALFGSLWGQIAPECRDFLITAEVLKDTLIIFAETDPSIDFSPVVVAYSKAVEKDVFEKLFRPFTTSAYATAYPEATTKKDVTRSIDALKAFVAGGRELTLGDMVFCLLNLGCKLRRADHNGFADFLQTKIADLEVFCEGLSFPKRLIQYVQEYRNKSAHVAKLPKEVCMAARAFLLEEPIRLLISLEELLRESPLTEAT